MTGLNTLKRLVRCKRGNTLMIVAGSAPLLIGAAAIGLDTIQVTLAKRQLQRSADSAAMAGAYAVLQNGAATPAVTRDLTLNNRIALATAPTVENAPVAGTYAGNPRAVRVVLRAERPVPFISFFANPTMTVEVEASAGPVPAGVFLVV